jgi:AcrR family transcriptional regulator
MSPRTRTIPDTDILAATARVIGRIGPKDFTLADVGTEVGLSPATLLQRFGSKRGLLLALVSSSVDQVDAAFEQVMAEHQSPVAALIDAASAMAQLAPSPEALANHLTFLQVDLQDADFHRHALDQARRTRDGYRSLIHDAIDAGELMPCDELLLARAVEAVAGGSLIAWAIHREGDAATYVRRDVVTLLSAYGVGVWARR